MYLTIRESRRQQASVFHDIKPLYYTVLKYGSLFHEIIQDVLT